jgi:hypothetical protein
MSLRRRILLKTIEVIVSIVFLVAAWFLFGNANWWQLGFLLAVAGGTGLFRALFGKGTFIQDAATPAKEGR